MKYYTREECREMSKGTAYRTPLNSVTEREMENALFLILGRRK